ncbi:MAG: hypothetical protein V4692_14545 [Bdellovibrionota bacterium]
MGKTRPNPRYSPDYLLSTGVSLAPSVTEQYPVPGEPVKSKSRLFIMSLMLLVMALSTFAKADNEKPRGKAGRNQIFVGYKNGKFHAPPSDTQASIITKQSSNGRGGVSMFFASGMAAEIIAEGASSSELDKSGPEMRLELIPAINVFGEYLGTVTQIAPEAYLASAHVLKDLEPDALKELLKKLGLAAPRLFQFKSGARYIDAVLISNAPHSISSLLSSQNPTETGNLYVSRHWSTLDDRMVEHHSQGAMSVSADGFIYLASGRGTNFSWGSSGALVFKKDSHENLPFAGILQCYIKKTVPASAPGVNGERVYYRVIPSTLLASAALVESNIEDLQARMADYDLGEKCKPVSGKDGGGG